MKNVLKVFVVLLLCNGSIAFSDSGTCNLTLVFKGHRDYAPGLQVHEFSIVTSRDRCYEIYDTGVMTMAQDGVILVTIGSDYLKGSSMVEWLQNEL